MQHVLIIPARSDSPAGAGGPAGPAGPAGAAPPPRPPARGLRRVPPQGPGQVPGPLPRRVVALGPRDSLVQVIAARLEHRREVPADRRAPVIAERAMDPGEQRLVQPGQPVPAPGMGNPALEPPPVGVGAPRAEG